MRNDRDDGHDRDEHGRDDEPDRDDEFDRDDELDRGDELDRDDEFDRDDPVAKSVERLMKARERVTFAIFGEAFDGPFLRYDDAGRPLVDVFRLKRGRGGDGRPCLRPVAHARISAHLDEFDLMEFDDGHGFPAGDYRAMLKGRDGQVIRQRDFSLGGAGEDDGPKADDGVTLLGRRARPAEAPAAPPPPPPPPAPSAELIGQHRAALEQAAERHRQHVEDLKSQFDERIAGVRDAHAAEVRALRSGLGQQVDSLTQQLAEARGEAKAVGRELGETRTALHASQIEVHGLKMRLELGSSAGAQPVDMGAVIRAFKRQQEAIEEARTLFAPPAGEPAGDTTPTAPDFSAALKLFDSIKADVGPVAAMVQMLEDD